MGHWSRSPAISPPIAEPSHLADCPMWSTLASMEVRDDD